MESSIQRAAVGQIAGIGDLYDAHTDSFTGLTILKKEVPETAVRLTDNPDTKIEFLTSDSLDDKFNFLNVSAELKVSILGGLVNFSGAGSFLQDERKSDRTARCSLIYNIKTKDQKLNLFHEDATDCYELQAIKDTKGTHIVTGVQWGANTIITAEETAVSEHHAREIKGRFEAELKMIVLKVSGKAAAEYEDKTAKVNKSFNIKVHGDVLPDSSSDLPTNYEQAIAFMKRMPELIQKSNNGWGKPLTYVLVPINEFRKVLNLQIRADLILREFSVQSIVRYTRLFEDFAAVKRKFNDVLSELEGHADCIPEEVRREFKKECDSLAVLEAQTRSDFARILKQVRAGKADAEEMEANVASVTARIDSRRQNLFRFEKQRKKMEFVDAIKKKPNVTFVGYNTTLSTSLLEIRSTEQKRLFVFYFTEADDGDEVWCKNREILYELLNKELQTKFLVVDCLSQSEARTLGPVSRLAIWKNGQEAVDDVRIARHETDGVSFGKCVNGLTIPEERPYNRADLLLPCPGNDCPPFDKQSWSCERCMSLLEYGFDGFIYCECGRGQQQDFVFRCNRKIHGPDFDKFNENVLKELLTQKRLNGEMNILIMGETGVGKSTFINAFANYMMYETLDDAAAGGLITVIPNSFTFREQEIKTGEATKQEVIQTGKSATQFAQVYTYQLEDKRLLRIIDTPGVGDVEGIEKDKENFKNIMDTISNLDEIHGILILMKPNEARLNLMFRFCISELLLHLHQSAAQNMIIGFTHTRATFYEPGGTKSLLTRYLAENTTSCRIELSKDTTYCFDSESYQYLAIINQGIELPADMRSDYGKSWDRSVKETKRLLDHVKSLRPHRVKDTCSLNEVRTLIVQLTAPLAEITRLIQQNQEMHGKQVQDLMATNKHGKELMQQLKIKMIGLVAEKIDFPRTVCTDKDCVTYETFHDAKQVKYTTTCHDHCNLKGIPTNTVNDEGLRNCWAISKDKCRHSNCGHHYRMHMHVNHVYNQSEIEVQDEKKKKLLDKNLSEKEKIEATTKDLLKLIDDSRLEEREVEKAAALFGCFLKKNAIIAVNDARSQYLEHLIREEKAKQVSTSDGELVMRLEAALRTHISEMRVINETIASGEGQHLLAPEAIKALIVKLCGMKIFGKMLRKMFETSINASHSEYQEHPISVRVKQPRPKQHGKRTLPVRAPCSEDEEPHSSTAPVNPPEQTTQDPPPPVTEPNVFVRAWRYVKGKFA